MPKVEVLYRFKRKKTAEEILESEQRLSTLRAISSEPGLFMEDDTESFVYDRGVITIGPNTIFNRLDDEHTTVRDEFYSVTIKYPYDEFFQLYCELTHSAIATTIQTIE